MGENDGLIPDVQQPESDHGERNKLEETTTCAVRPEQTETSASIVYEKVTQADHVQANTVADNTEQSDPQIDAEEIVQVNEVEDTGNNHPTATRCDEDRFPISDSKLTPRSQLSVWHDDCRHAHLFYQVLNCLGLPRIHPMQCLNQNQIREIWLVGGTPAQCRWYKCGSTLHDADTVRRHALAFHYHQNLLGRLECWFDSCLRWQDRGGTLMISVPILNGFYEWMDHINLQHFKGVYTGPRALESPDGSHMAPIELSSSPIEILDLDRQHSHNQTNFLQENLEEERAVYVSKRPSVDTIPDGWGVRYDDLHHAYFFMKLQ